MAKYRAIFKVPEHNYYMDGSVLESTDLRTVWRAAYSDMRRFMRETEGSSCEMHIAFRKEVPALSTEKDTCWKHVALISGYVHEKELSACDRILGFERNLANVYAIRERAAK